MAASLVLALEEGHDARIIAEAILHNALHRWTIDPSETEVHLVAREPLQIVLERPDEVALDITASSDSITHSLDVVMQVLLTFNVVNSHSHVVLLPRETVLRDIGGDVVVRVLGVDEQVTETRAIDSPASLGERPTRSEAIGHVHVLGEAWGIRYGGATGIGDVREVVVQSDKVEATLDDGNLLGGEGRETSAHSVDHGLRVVTLDEGIHEPAEPKI